MIYKHFENSNFEDFSSGRVIYNNVNFPNFSVRIAGEIFSRCLEHTQKKKDICLYDPCCGSAYMLTVLGYLFNEIIQKIYCSDISIEAIELSKKNLSLLSFHGINRRKNEINELIKKFNKESHKSALCSLAKIENLLKKEISSNIFMTNILSKPDFIDKKFCADIVITDVPYGNLVSWSNNSGEELNVLLDGILPIIELNSIIAISYNKKQKINNQKYRIIEKHQIGHRRIDILKLK
jgi:hypothetical protein